MVQRIQRLRHNAADAAVFIGLLGEITADYESNALHLHDGSTPGGKVFSSDTQLATIFQTANALITAFGALVANGIVTKNGTVMNARSIVAGAGISVTNGDGIAANPTVTLNAGTAAMVDVGTGAGQVPLATSVPGLVGGVGAQFPIGAICMWSGTIASIPANYHLCNGAGGAIDLRNKFIVCADADVLGVAKSTVTGAATQTGGAYAAGNTGAGGDHNHTGSTGSHILDITEMPSHTHDVANFPTGAPGAGTLGDTALAMGTTTATTTSAGSNAGHTHTIGASGTHTHTTPAVIPPYYALAFIQRLT